MLQDSQIPSNHTHNAPNTLENPNTIEQARVEIDNIDHQLLQLLGRRMQCAEVIGRYKKQHNLPIVQVVRWQEILNAAVQKGSQLNLSSEFVTAFLTAVHDESVRHQKLIVNT